MLNLNISRPELEFRILKIIEDFNGCPLGKKSKRLSILNKSMRTLFYGDAIGMTKEGGKMNEHNIDSFFKDETERKTTSIYILSENYRHSVHRNNEAYTTTYHPSQEEAEYYLFKNTINEFIRSDFTCEDGFYSMLPKECIDDILSNLTDSELNKLKSRLVFDIYDAEIDSEFASYLAIEIANTKNIKAIKALFDRVTQSANVIGHHNIKEQKTSIEASPPKPVSILSIVVMSSNSELHENDELHPSNYFSAFSHKEEVLRMYKEIIKYNVGINIDFIERLASCKMLPSSLRNNLDEFKNSSFEEIAKHLVSELPVQVLLSQDFVRSILSPKKKVLIHYEIKEEKSS